MKNITRKAGIPIAQAGGLPPIRRELSVRNSYDAAKTTRLNADWLMPQTSADAEIGYALTALIGRAQEHERNVPFVRRYLNLLDNNVLGADGVGFQNRAKDPSGTLDQLANDAIKSAWMDFGKRSNLDVAGKLCFREAEGLMLRRTAVEGNALARIHYGTQYKYGIALEFMDLSRLDLNYSTNLPNGNIIRFGIEMNRFGKVVAYHIFTANPNDSLTRSSIQREEVSAAEIIHCYWIERPNQTVGVTWFAGAMQSLEHLAKYREAELVAARMEACKGYAIKPEKPEGWNGPTDADGRQLQEMTPGMGMMLNPGEEIVQFTPQHPNSAFTDFIKTGLREVAAEMGVSYNSLSVDYSDVNYSSMRSARLEETEEYKNIQSWLIESFHAVVYEKWLAAALTKGAIKTPNGSALPASKFDKFNAPDWKPRRWPWVDPLKDLQAAVMAVEKGFASRRSLIAENSGDIEQVFQEQEMDNALAERLGLTFPIGTNPQNPQPDNAQNKTTNL